MSLTLLLISPYKIRQIWIKNNSFKILLLIPIFINFYQVQWNRAYKPPLDYIK